MALTNTIRVEATLRASLRTVAINSKLGKLEKSSGLKVCMATIKITNDRSILDTKKTSKRNTGSGSTIIATSTIIPNGNIPDLAIAEILFDSADPSFVNSTTSNSPCQKIVT